MQNSNTNIPLQPAADLGGSLRAAFNGCNQTKFSVFEAKWTPLTNVRAAKAQQCAPPYVKP